MDAELGPDGLKRLEAAVESQALPTEAPQTFEADPEGLEVPPGYRFEDNAPEESSDPYTRFPDEIRQDVEGLMWLGYLEDSFEFCGHHFVLRTLRADEELLAAQLSKEYVDSLGQAKAWAWSNICLSLLSVDYDEAFCPPLGPDKAAFARARFQWVTSRWFWPIGRHLFARYAALYKRMEDAVEAMANL